MSRHARFPSTWLAPLVLLTGGTCQAPHVAWLNIAVHPDHLDFSTVPPALPVEQTVELTNVGDVALYLASITLAQANDITLPASELLSADCLGNTRMGGLLVQAGECARFAVRFSPSIPESITNQVIISSSTSDGRLFGFFVGASSSLLDELDRTDGTILSETNIAIDGASGFAFSSWGEDFWFFVGLPTGDGSGIYHYTASTGVTTLAMMVTPVIVGAGVSPCAH